MKNTPTFEGFLNEGSGRYKFDTKLFYLVGKNKTGKYEFTGGFKSKTDRDGIELSPMEAQLHIRKLQFESAGFTDIKVVTGTELAIMIASGETSIETGLNY